MEAYKNSRNTIASHWRNSAVFFSLLLMVVSVYISRGALSIAIIIFLLLASVHHRIYKQLKIFVATPFLLCCSLLFFIPLISGLWSDDLDKWSDVLRIKLPLLLFPVAFAGNWKLTQKQWLYIACFFLLTVLGGCVWGLMDYAAHASEIHARYLQAKTIVTPLENDHVRFSWLVTVAVILSILLINGLQNKKAKILFALLAVFFVIYLHLLSARTGIVALYIFFILYAVWLVFSLKRRRLSVIFFMGVFLLPLIAYLFFPTFKARIQYNLYDLSFVQKQQYLPGSSDGARAMSLKAGWQVLEQNPWGVGAGDVMNEAGKWYQTNVPQVVATDKFYPSSEWLMYGCFAGWPGIILFTFIIILPFSITVKENKIFWIAFHATAAFSFAFDMGLEVQYGVFLYSFIGCWWWKWFALNNHHRL